MPFLVPYNWRQVKMRYCPSVDQIRRLGRNRRLKQTEVTLGIDPRCDIVDIREWLRENCAHRYGKFGSFKIIEHAWEMKVEYNGVVFSFPDIAAAVHFKLAWYKNEPSFND